MRSCSEKKIAQKHSLRFQGNLSKNVLPINQKVQTTDYWSQEEKDKISNIADCVKREGVKENKSFFQICLKEREE